MAIEIPAAIYDQWVRALEPLADRDTENSAMRVDSVIRMTPKAVLELLMMAKAGTHTLTVDDDSPRPWPRLRVVALDEIVTLSSDDDDEWARSVIANAERLTGIKINQGGEKS